MTIVTSSIYKTHQIFVVKATDADAGPDGTLTYTLTQGNEDSVFVISSSGGVITIKTEPTKGYYPLDVTISDNASSTKKKSIQCRVLVYFSSLPMTTYGDVMLGDEIQSEEISLLKDEKIEIPVFVQLGLHNLEGVDIELTVPADVATIESVNTDYNVIRLSDNKVRIVGLTDPDTNIFGVHKFTSLVLKGVASKEGTVTVQSKINGLVSQELKDISSTTSDSNSCFDQANIVADCELSIKDAAYIQTYVRAQANAFSSSLGNKLSGASKTDMDIDQNGVVNSQDASIMTNSLLGNTLTLTSFEVIKPGLTKTNDAECALVIEAETRFNSLDKSVIKSDDFRVYLLVSQSSKEPLSKQLTDSNIQITSSFTSVGAGSMKNVFAIPMSSSADGKFKLISQSSALLETDVGLSLVIVNINRPNDYSKTFQTSSTTTVEAGKLVIDQSTVSINPQDEPQVKETFAQTSHRCANPLVTMQMRMKLEGDFNKDIAVKQDEFKSVFKSYFEAHMADKHKYQVTISNIRLSEGSVVTEFDVQHEAADADGIIDSVIDDIGNNNINVPFGGDNYPAQPTLIVGDQERISQPTSDEEDPLLKAYIAIAVVVALVLLMGIVICCYLSQKKEKHLVKEKDDFERKLSDPDFPSMASQSKGGVVNNAYEYFKTLDNSQCHSPNTKHVIDSLRKPPFNPLEESENEVVPAAQAPHEVRLEETRSSLRRRVTPKSLEEMQRELRVSSLSDKNMSDLFFVLQNFRHQSCCFVAHYV